MALVHSLRISSCSGPAGGCERVKLPQFSSVLVDVRIAAWWVPKKCELYQPEMSATYSQTPPGLARPHVLLIMNMKHENSKLAALTDVAIEAIRTLVTDPNTPPAVRLRAAKF